MELLLALAAVVVAYAGLALANIFHRRFAAYGSRLDRAEQAVVSLQEQLRKTTNALEHQGQASKTTAQQLSERNQENWRDFISKYERTRETISLLTKSGHKFREEVATALQNQDTRLHSLDQGCADQVARIDALGQQSANYSTRLGVLEKRVTRLSALEDLVAKVAQLRERAASQATELTALKETVTSAGEHTSKALADISHELVDLDTEVERLDVDREDLRTQLRKWLDHQVRLITPAAAAHVMAGFIHAEHQATTQTLSHLYESVLRSNGVDVLFREQHRPADLCYYLAWPRLDDQSPEQQLSSLLNAASSDADTLLTGATELRALLCAMPAGGSATVRLGPLIVSHTAGGAFLGTVLTPEETQPLAGNDPPAGPAQWAELLSRLADNRVVNLHTSTEG